MRLCAIFLILNIHVSHISASPPNPPELSSESNNNPQGYECGDVFFTYDKIRDTLSLARDSIDKGYLFPQKYLSPLYSGSRYKEYLIYPIRKGPQPQPNLQRPNTGFYVVLTRNSKKEVDVVAKITTGDYTKCIRIYRPPTALASDTNREIIVQPPNFGYVCGKVSFDGEVLKRNADIAKSKALNVIKGRFPEEYSGRPFNEPCLIWPLMEDGSLYMRGHMEPFRLVLTPDYKVLSVAMLIKDKLKACERDTGTVSVKKNHDKSAYHCNKQIFSHWDLLTAAEEACEKMNTAIDSIYPATYIGSKFKIHGPYFTYPVFRNSVSKKFRLIAGLHRVVININCEIVGALTTLKVVYNENPKIRFRTKLVKCHRLNDGRLPSGYFNDNAKAVFEDKVRS